MRGTATAHSLVKGDSKWKDIATNGWQDNWPDYDQAGITMDSKIYFFGMFMVYVNIICKGVIPSFIIRWSESWPIF